MRYRSELRGIRRRITIRRARRRAHHLWYAAAAFLAAAASVSLFSHASLYSVRTVEVIGISGETVASIERLAGELSSRSVAGVISRSHMLFYPSGAIEEQIQDAVPYLGDVSVALLGWGKARIAVRARDSIGLWCGVKRDMPEPCTLFDGGGFLFATATSGTPLLSRFFGPVDAGGTNSSRRTFLSETEISPLVEFLGRLDRLGFSVGEVLAGDQGERTGFLENGGRITWKADSDLEKSALNFIAALPKTEMLDASGKPRQNIEYIDLRFTNKVIYKMRE